MPPNTNNRLMVTVLSPIKLFFGGAGLRIIFVLLHWRGGLACVAAKGTRGNCACRDRRRHEERTFRPRNAVATRRDCACACAWPPPLEGKERSEDLYSVSQIYRHTTHAVVAA
jgi:hypothetical protein